MSLFAAAMTGLGTGAISTVQVFGDSAETLLKQIFRAQGTNPPTLTTGNILLGTICEGNRVIDQVTLGCEGPATFAIHCHGNPLIVEMIMQLLQRRGATLLTPEQFLARLLTIQEPDNTIKVEAQLVQPKIKTLQGAKIVAGQVNAGLAQRAQDWPGQMDEIVIDKIKAEATQILQKSQAGKLIIYGCTAVLAGPPNSGKSTLLNYLAGRQKSIVADIEGTTRDWVEATCRIGPLFVTLIDTAGLGRELSGDEESIEEAAQKQTTQILERADLVLFVLDNSQPAEEFDDRLLEGIADKRIITVLNKSDLPARFDKGKLPGTFSNTVHISAKEGTGIEQLRERIRGTLGVDDFDPQQPICFTARQENLLKQLTNAKANQRAVSTIAELLHGQVELS
ncbi:MAG TPA: GTPase [Sedimentisphaerales bacterium]|jgi:tRNA modification GTPase|nr:GTPase [Sedimentisphaerales bacterium]